MEVCVMIEGQEGVTWEQWLALARAARRSDRRPLPLRPLLLSFDRPDARGTLDAWTTLAGLAFGDQGGSGSARWFLLAMFRHPLSSRKSP